MALPIHEHERVVLLVNIPGSGLVTGDVGTVLHVYEHARAYEVEFNSVAGEPLAILTLSAPCVRAGGTEEVAHVRMRKRG